MTKVEIVSETPIAMAVLKEELKRVKERDGELNFRAGKTQDHLNLFVGISAKDAAELTKKLEELSIPRLKSEHIIKIVDVLPASEGEVKAVLQGYPLTITADSMKKIAETAKEYAEKNDKEMKKIDLDFTQKLKKEAEERVKEEAEAKKTEKAAVESAKKSESDEELPDEEEAEITETGIDKDAE